MSENVGTLRSRLIRRLLTLQAGLLVVFALLILVTLLSGLALEKRDEDRIIGILQQALARDANGELVLLPGPDLAQLRSESPNLWFLIRDQGDHSLSEGDVPESFRRIGGALDGVGQAKLGWDKPQDQGRNNAGQMKRVDSPAGEVQIIATTNVKMSAAKSAMHFGLRIFLLSMPPKKVMSILGGAFRHMRADGAFYQFTYGPQCPIPRPILDRLGLKATRVGRTMRNVPPAAVYRVTRRAPSRFSVPPALANGGERWRRAAAVLRA